MKKLKMIRRLIMILIVFGLLFLGYYTYMISPTDYQFTTHEYVNKKVDSSLNGFKIAYIADTNLTNKKSVERFEEIISKLNDRPFDMVIFGGDLFDGPIIESKTISQALKSIHCQYGKFAVLGEKDETSSLEVTQILNEGGFEVIDNTVRTIYYKETQFLLYAYHDESNFDKLKEDVKTITVNIAHQPDTFQTTQGKFDLQLSSHSYGGSIYIPYYGALLTPDGAKTYHHGVYEKSNSTLVVSNGISGPSAFPYKFFAKNEINFITLNSSSSH